MKVGEEIQRSGGWLQVRLRLQPEAEGKGKGKGKEEGGTTLSPSQIS